METIEHIDGISECIVRAIQEHLANSNISIEWSQKEKLICPVLRVEVFLENTQDGQDNAKTSRCSKRIVSVCILDFFPIKTMV